MIHAFCTLCFRRKRVYWIGKKFFVYQCCTYILLSDIIRFPMFLFAYVNLKCLFPTHQFHWLKRSSISSANVLLTQLWATKQNTRWFDMSRVLWRKWYKLCKLSVNQKRCYGQFGVDIIFKSVTKILLCFWIYIAQHQYIAWCIFFHY